MNERLNTLSDEELALLHRLTLDMATVFVDFCRRHELLCYLCGGGCIGALRHQGFIPWDDDLDFFMPREDYERMIRLWQTEMDGGRYVLEVPDDRRVTGSLFVNLRDRETTMIKPYQTQMDLTHGIVLDVLPLDGCPSGWRQRKSQCLWALIYSLYCAQIVPVNHGWMMRTLGKLALAVVPGRRARCRLWRLAERRMTRWPIRECAYITELCSGPGYMKNRYPAAVFSAAEFLPFEDTLLPVPVDADTYLRMVFGDYMQLPLEDKRTASHDVVFLDLQHSYTAYKGIYYCTKGENA